MATSRSANSKRSSQFSRDEAPAELVRAKGKAVERLLRSSRAATLPMAFTASSLPDENIVGIGIGPKLVKGKATGTVCVRIYVASKLPLGSIPKRNLLPEKFNDIATDIVQIGRLLKFGARLRPAKPGSSVGFVFPPPKNNRVMAGTFGAVATAAGQRYILSNNHVLADEGKLKKGSLIYQPGLLDGGNPTKDSIAKLTRFVPLSKSHSNKVDCAIAQVLSTAKVSARVLPKVGKLRSAQPIDAVHGLRVHKTGRTTSYTTGQVQDVSADVTVGYEMGPITFQEQIIITGDGGVPFSAPGDSGSMIVDRGSQRATGLLFAGSASHTIANHMSDVLAALGIALEA